MAFVPLTPTTLNIVCTQGLGQEFQAAAVTGLGNTTPVDLSAWVSLSAKAVAAAPNPCTADQSFGTVTGDASGILKLQFAATDLASVPLGAAKLVISGKPTAGDALQVLATGAITLNAG